MRCAAPLRVEYNAALDHIHITLHCAKWRYVSCRNSYVENRSSASGPWTLKGHVQVQTSNGSRIPAPYFEIAVWSKFYEDRPKAPMLNIYLFKHVNLMLTVCFCYMDIIRAEQTKIPPPSIHVFQTTLSRDAAWAIRRSTSVGERRMQACACVTYIYIYIYIYLFIYLCISLSIYIYIAYIYI